MSVSLSLPPGSLHQMLLFSDYALTAALCMVLFGIIACCVALSRNKFLSVLKVNAIRSIQKERTLTNEEKKFNIAMQAETNVENVLAEEGWSYLFPNRRVSVSRVGHNREIDIIAVGPRILVIEVKHWRGMVWSSGSSWYQRPHRKAQTLQFEDVYSDNVEKAAALRRYIENTRRIPLPDCDLIAKDPTESITSMGTWYSNHSLHTRCGAVVIPIVVFSNPDVRLDPESILQIENVFTLDTFRNYLRGLRWEQRWYTLLWRTLRCIVSRKRVEQVSNSSHHSSSINSNSTSEKSEAAKLFLSSETKRRVAEAVDVLRTWDVLYLHDGRMLTGDVLSVIAPNAFCMYERKHLLQIEIRWNTGLIGFVRTFLTNRCASVELMLTAAKRLAVKKRENKPRNAKGNIFFTIQPRKRKLTVVDRIEFRIPGNTTPKIIALADIKKIMLSKHLYPTEELVMKS